MKIFGVTTDGETRFHIADSFEDAIAIDLSFFIEENGDGGDDRSSLFADHKELLEQVVCVGDVYKGLQ